MRQRPFRFGLINEHMLPPPTWLDHVRRAEVLGYATFLLRDHIVPDYFGDQYAPLIALAAAAGITSRLRLGTMVLANDFRHPALLAKEIATLDALSGGRVEVGIGAGWLRSEYEAARAALGRGGHAHCGGWKRHGRSYEGSGRRGRGFTGAHYNVRGLRCVPLLAQQPTLFLGGGHERMLKLAGRFADSVGLLTTSVATGTMVADPAERTPEAVERKLNWVRAGAGARYDTIELSLIPTVVLSDDRVAATARLIGERGWQGLHLEEIWAMPAVLVGDIAQIATTIHERRNRFGFSYYVFSDHQIEELAPLVAQLTGQ
ncbi:TIGR03621 family F420-dependent LLM class oxidoreductase [Candidatus Gracilibacteria bacterium]|nr:TIGR03621 family F420-dependent LLM class oxidoreductase [Candidatus Gracilibacteria bacterium]